MNWTAVGELPSSRKHTIRVTNPEALKSHHPTVASVSFNKKKYQHHKYEPLNVDMGGIDTNIAAAALAIALVAFVTALGQLLQQYFATADGYRRCQRSVMGEWATKTRLRWRWREFRFETLYTTPEFFMTEGMLDRSNHILIEGSTESRALSLGPALRSSPSDIRHSNETVCWVSLLNQLHLSSARNGACNTEGISLPALSLQERSWDFQLPDIVRPLGVCSVSDIAIIARRLGMRWKDFRPFEGSLKAEGYSQFITSTNVRSLGIVLQYNYTWKEEWRPTFRLGMIRGFKRQKEERYMPTVKADRLGFGILTGLVDLNVPDLVVGTRQEILATLNVLDESGKSAASLRDLYNEDLDYHLRTADLVAMTTAMTRLRGRSHVQVPAPSENMYGFTTTGKGRRAFRICLQKYLEDSRCTRFQHSPTVLSTCQHLFETWKEWEWQSFDSIYTDQIPARLPPSYLDAVHDEYNKCTNWIVNKQTLLYRNLLGAHIRYGIFRPDGETGLVAVQHPDYEADVEGYFAAWPQILADLADGQDEVREEVLFDAWVVMLFRACCWGACHFFVPGERVPSAYYGSQLPVYIG